MDGYLVVARCQSNDVPIGLAATYEEAIAILKGSDYNTVHQATCLLSWSPMTDIEAYAIVEFKRGIALFAVWQDMPPRG